MNVLVTGGSGFIGANLCRELRIRGHDVAVIDDLSTGYRSNLEPIDARFSNASILDVDALARAAAGAESIVHLAARGSVPRSVADPVATNAANVVGTLNVLEAARRTDAQVIIASSSSVYGANIAMPKNERMTLEPMSPYAASKVAAEAYGVAYQKSYGLATLVFRFFNVYGPLQSARHPYAAVVPSFLAALIDGQPLTVYGDGSQSRDFTPVDSVVEIIALGIEQKVTYDYPVNLAFGGNYTLLDLIARLRDITGRDADVVHKPARVGDVRASQADNSQLRRLFPSVAVPSLDDGLRKTWSWFLESGGEQA